MGIGAMAPPTIERFEPAAVKALLQRQIDPKVKLSNDSVLLAGEYLRLYVVEAVQRAESEARADIDVDGSGEEQEVVIVEPRHLEKVLPKLMVDF